MKTHLSKVLSFTAILIFISNSIVFAQTQENRQVEARVDVITYQAGVKFKEGLLNLKDNLRPKAREKFDEAIEVFLTSGFDLPKTPTLHSCYNQMFETIYQLEYPAINQQQQLKMLSMTCNWQWKESDFQLAEAVAKLVLTAPITPTGDNPVITSKTNANTLAQGFTDQKYEPSPLDELSQLQLTPDEANVETPQAQEQIQYIQVAVSNKSLGFSFKVHPMIQQYLNYYQGRGRGTMETGLYRSGMFMRMARRIFREEGIPENVAWLGQVESMWKPSALSWAAASGLWQFIPGTGARFGLRRTAYLDERNSFEKATRASAQYLKFLVNRYGGNWELGMAAYNCGEGNVDRAIARAGVRDFWAAYPYLPKETRNYVPNILATILIANNPQQYGFGQVRPAPQLMYDQIRVPSLTNLSLVAQASDTTVEYLRYLNPELRTNSTPPEPYIIRVPAGKANDVVAVFKRINPSNNTASVANTSRGETWATISNRTGVSVADLMAANGNAPVPGRKVIVPQGNNVRSTNYSRPTTQIAVPTANTVRVVKARNGDTVTTLAAREKASATEIAKFNGLLPTSKLAAGREIKIPKSN